MYEYITNAVKKRHGFVYVKGATYQSISKPSIPKKLSSPILPYLRQRSRSTKSKIVPHTILPTTILLFQNLFSSKINSQSPILPYLRQRSRSTKSIIVPHTTLPTTIPLFQNLFSLSNHNLLIFISIPCTFYFLSVLILHKYLSVLFFLQKFNFPKAFYILNLYHYLVHSYQSPTVQTQNRSIYSFELTQKILSSSPFQLNL